ncbi:MAG TPA: hypothetical protein VM901_02360 [Bdellovibrionota bacterium]|nr:hypothetical protein [Bdellovibrionota bacterium]
MNMEVDLQTYKNFVTKRWLALLVFLGLCIGGALVATKMPKEQYRSSIVVAIGQLPWPGHALSQGSDQSALLTMVEHPLLFTNRMKTQYTAQGGSAFVSDVRINKMFGNLVTVEFRGSSAASVETLMQKVITDIRASDERTLSEAMSRLGALNSSADSYLKWNLERLGRTQVEVEAGGVSLVWRPKASLNIAFALCIWLFVVGVLPMLFSRRRET